MRLWTHLQFDSAEAWQFVASIERSCTENLLDWPFKYGQKDSFFAFSANRDPENAR